MADGDGHGLVQEYLEISPNIYSSFPRFRPPVGLYRFDEHSNDTRVFCKAGDRMSKEMQAEAAEMCDKGLLYLSTQDYKVFAEHLSKNLGLILTETKLSNHDVADIIYRALRTRYDEFIAQPVEMMLEPLKKDLTVLCEWLWADSDRVRVLKEVLRAEHTAANHAVNTCYVGLSVFMLAFGEDKERLKHMSKVALGLMLHDLGMSNVPPYVIDQTRPLLNKERVRVEEHPAIGLKMLSRIEGMDEEVVSCVAEHHERFTGRGYPRGIKSEGISELGRICALADSFSAMVSNRKYAEASKLESAALNLFRDPGYDKELAKILVGWVMGKL